MARSLLQKTGAAPKSVVYDGVRPLPSKRGMLSQAEIEALLRPDLSDLEASDKPSPKVVELPTADTKTRSAPVADFQLEDDEAIASALTLALRRDCALEAGATVKTAAFGRARDALAQTGAGWASLFFSDDQERIVAVLALDPVTCAAIISIACGAPRSAGRPETQALTYLDAALLEGLLKPVARAIGEGLTLARVETEAEFASALAPPGQVRTTTLTLATPHGAGAAMLCRTSDARPAGPRPDASPPSVTALLTARIASLSVPVSRLADLKPGATLLLGLPADQPVELLSGGREGRLAAEGQIGRKGGRIAIRLNRVKPPSI